MLTQKEAYLAAFHYLDEIYNQEPSEALGNLLSSMNPYLFQNTNSADPATWHDWKRGLKQNSDKGEVSETEAFEAMIRLIAYYREAFNFDLLKIEKGLKKNGQNERWSAWVQNVKAPMDKTKYLLR